MKKLVLMTVALLAALTLICGCTAVKPASQQTPAEASAEPEAPAEPVEPEAPAEPEAPTGPEAPAQSAGGALKGIYDSMASSGVLPEMMSVNEALVTDFYGITPEQYVDAVFYISYDSLLADEVVLLSAADEASADAVEALLNARLNAKAEEADGYSPEQAAIIKACSVTRNGLELALVVSPEAKTLLDIYLAGLNG